MHPLVVSQMSPMQMSPQMSRSAPGMQWTCYSGLNLLLSKANVSFSGCNECNYSYNESKDGQMGYSQPRIEKTEGDKIGRQVTRCHPCTSESAALIGMRGIASPGTDQ